MTNKFGAGVCTGVIVTLAAFAAAALTYKTQVMDPEADEEDRLEENRIRANRKSHAAHLG